MRKGLFEDGSVMEKFWVIIVMAFFWSGEGGGGGIDLDPQKLVPAEQKNPQNKTPKKLTPFSQI